MPSMDGGPQARVSSPPSGFSILITSAPRSDSIMVQNGPAKSWVRSITRRPSSGRPMFKREKSGLDLCLVNDSLLATVSPLLRSLTRLGTLSLVDNVETDDSHVNYHDGE